MSNAKKKASKPSAAPVKKSAKAPVRKAVKVGFVSLGCPKNLVDSEVMMGMLTAGGARITPRAEEAEVIVVNTCSFIDSAKQESIDAILEMSKFKTEGRAKKLIVAGCLVERYRDEILAQLPEVDAVVGTDELGAILAAAGVAVEPVAISNPALPILNSGSVSQQQKSGLVKTAPAERAEATINEKAGRFSREQWQGAERSLPTYLYDDETPRVLATGKFAAYIKIAEGCDHPCSFCVIPQLRGKFRSRRLESVIAEAERLAEQGVREITLIGQDTSCYGEDLGIKDGLAILLESLAKIEKLRWVRFLYAYPNKITTRMLEALASSPKICPYVDVPLQHASAGVLKRMRRGGSSESFLRLVEKMRRIVPNLTLRTSMIVGFPGETEEEFAELCDFITKARFDWLGVFGYSDEEGARAFKLEDKLKPAIIEKRRRKLMSIQKKISRAQRKQMLGKVVDIMIEGPSSESEMLWEARSQAHAPEIDGKLYVTDFGDHKRVKPGEFYRAEITEAFDYDLSCALLEKI